jgi:sodium/hydrogen antiporter
VYGFEAYHVLLAVLGAGIILAYWLPRMVSGREPAASGLLILAGFAGFSFIPGMPEALDPTRDPKPWEIAAELAVIISLFGTGLRIDRLAAWRQWSPTVRMLSIAMPLTIFATAAFGWLAAGMTLAGALLLGAVLAPTDPVLAGDVQVGPPLEGGEHPVRFTLTAEAGLNDGLAFPFVHLGVAFATAGALTLDLAAEWLWRDVLYRIAVGAAGGLIVGRLLGKLLFEWPRGNALAETGAGVVALAGVLLCYGATELAEGYGFIAAFVAGVTLRRVESHHDFHRRLHSFSESLEHALTAIILVAVGGALPVLWPYLDRQHIMIAVALIFLIRPLAGWVSLGRTMLKKRERLVVAFYGVRGIGSVYYLAYAGSHIELVNEEALWATIAFTILISTVVHGLSAGIAVERVAGEASEQK